MSLQELLIAQDFPVEFKSELGRFAQDWNERAGGEQKAALAKLLKEKPECLKQLSRTLIGSNYVAEQCLQNPALLCDLLASDAFAKQLDAEELKAALGRSVETESDEAFDRTLRQFRHRFMVITIWRDLNRLANLEQTTHALSDFAALAVQAAIDYHYQQLAKLYGVPVSAETNTIQPMLVLGMGKLGAWELNLSSDIDLIFAFPESGQTEQLSIAPEQAASTKQKTLSNSEFFLRLGQRIIKSLDTTTVDGFVFRVDMRLRPYGQSGALASSFDALEDYYQTQGREWERYAMIKARCVAVTSDEVLRELAGFQSAAAASKWQLRGGADYVENLRELLQPFVYRRYLDFSAIDSLREMKMLIAREVQRKGLQHNVKLGSGGIREVEFVVQVFQLIRGGRDLHLRDPRLQVILPILEQEHYLPEGVAASLGEAYRFLRDTEHAIQAWQDRQTQQLPVDERDQLRLAWVMGFDNWESFSAQLQSYRDHVNEQFRAVISEAKPGVEQQSDGASEWQLLWQGRLSEEASLRFLAEQGFDDVADEGENNRSAKGLLNHLTALRENRQVMSMQAAARERLDNLMPLLLVDLAQLENPVTSLQRIASVLEAVARRSAYIVLLVENPSARIQLTKLCEASSWIANQLAAHPMLLDELLDARNLYSPPDKNALANELQQEVMRLNWDDLEGHMECLRQFRLALALRIAACEVTGILPLMKVSDYLTFLAEVILDHVLELAWRQLVGRHGRPRRKEDSGQEIDFLIVAYGKLGGIELGHGSDLDLVFVHAGDTSLSTDGAREIDNPTFFARLGQKIIHILNTQTLSGQLYEVDMRLRPSGNSGLLVSSLAAFEKYQFHDAWVWEHQALVRARPVAGNPKLSADFENLRQRVLCQKRDNAELKTKVIEMREKMFQQLGSKAKSSKPASSKPHLKANSSKERQSDSEPVGFHLKQDRGGIVDIEFMVQYAVLAWAHKDPALVRYTDNIRILEALAAGGFLAAEDGQRLIEIYKTYRSMVHRLALQGLPSVVAGDPYAAERAEVQRLWHTLLG